MLPRGGRGHTPVRHAWFWDVSFLVLLVLITGPVVYLAADGWLNR